MHILKNHLKFLFLCLLQKPMPGIFLELLTHHEGIKELLLTSMECAVLDWMNSWLIFFFIPSKCDVRSLPSCFSSASA